MSDHKQMVSELRRLRGGRGMVAGRTSVCISLMAELDVDAGELHRRIVSTLKDMGSSEVVRALRNAYGIDLTNPGILTQRRIDFGVEHGGRSPDTIEVWENKAVDELLARLLDPSPSALSQSFSASFVVTNRRITSTYASPGSVASGKPLDPHTPRQAIPLFIYQLPADTPSLFQLLLLGRFIDETPSKVLHMTAFDLVTLTTTATRWLLKPKHFEDRGFTEYVATYGSPSAGQYFAMVWNW